MPMAGLSSNVLGRICCVVTHRSFAVLGALDHEFFSVLPVVGQCYWLDTSTSLKTIKLDKKNDKMSNGGNVKVDRNHTRN